MALTNTEINAEEIGGIVRQIQEVAAAAESVRTAPALREGLYALGYKLYNAGSYKDAETIFKALCIFDSKDSRFWIGFAGCLQAQGELKDAVNAYKLAAKANLKDPSPIFYAALCCLKLGATENAVASLKSLLAADDRDDPAFKDCQARAAALLSLIGNE